MEEIIICDIDGTIADVEHRRPHVAGKKKDFESFYAKQSDDTVIKPTLEVVRKLCWYGEYGLLFVSGRPEKYRKVTEEWLALWCRLCVKNSVLDESWMKYLEQFGSKWECLGLLMRPDDDNRSDAIVKEEIYLNKIKPWFEVFMVLDDRNKVVEMWRKHGLICHQVADGNF